MGILRRAKARDKELPIQLKTALEIQSGVITPNIDVESLKQKDKETICLCDQGGQRMDLCHDMTGTLTSNSGGHQPIVMATQQGNAEICKGICPTITSSAGMSGNNQPVLFDNHGKDCRYNGPLDVAPTVAATYETSDTSYCIAANTIDREPQNGGNGKGFQSNVSYTLTTSDIHAVFKPKLYQKVVGALMASDYKGVNTVYVDQAKCIVDTPYQETVGALCNGDYKGPSNQYVSQDKCIVDNQSIDLNDSNIKHNLVRRLTPLECERLQGFPDNWTNINKAADSPRYKALGNSVAVPCVDFVMRGIAYFLRKEKEVA